uniref:Uncharacterized protein n=1 Tax=Arundo donax TaxID=35708 RepID=A0A0A9EVV7_ARUDO
MKMDSKARGEILGSKHIRWEHGTVKTRTKKTETKYTTRSTRGAKRMPRMLYS